MERVIAIQQQGVQMGRALMLASLLLMLALWWVQPAQAADGLAAKQQQFDALYMELLDNPLDEDKTLSYAELAVESGDYEAAIPPMERLLLLNPNVARLKLELGILYYLLGSHDVAKSYLVQVQQSMDADPSHKTQANSYLQRM